MKKTILAAAGALVLLSGAQEAAARCWIKIDVENKRFDKVQIEEVEFKKKNGKKIRPVAEGTVVIGSGKKKTYKIDFTEGKKKTKVKVRVKWSYYTDPLKDRAKSPNPFKDRGKWSDWSDEYKRCDERHRVEP